MADPIPDAVRQRLEALHDGYRRRLPDRVARLRRHWEGLRAAWDRTAAEALQVDVHNLKGSAGTYGHPDIAEAAAAIETVLDRLKNEGKTGEESEKCAIDDLLRRIEGRTAGS